MFRKKDEMELDVQLKSNSIAYIFTQVLLIIWIIIGVCTKKNIVLPLYIFLAQYLTKSIAVIAYKKLYKDDRHKIAIISLVCIVLLVLFLMIVGR